MNIVYKITFTKRKESGILPYYYIGSKTNCAFSDGSIYSGKKKYWGSAKYENYSNIVKEDECVAEVLYQGDTKDLLIKEKEFQILYDAVRSPGFFNRNYAVDNNFTDPNYASYKHVDTGKVIRLLRDDEMVLNGTYVGVTFGNVLSEDERKKRGRKGNDNAFYGKTHTNEVRNRISEANTGRQKSQVEIDNWIEKVAKKPKSKEHREKIGKSGLVMLKNINTFECIRIPKDEIGNYDNNIWKNPYTVSLMIKRGEINDRL